MSTSTSVYDAVGGIRVLRFDRKRRYQIPIVVYAAAAIGVALPANAGLLVSNNGLNNVLHYDRATGDFVEAFVPGSNTQPGTGGLRTPNGITVGPDGNVYVASAGPPVVGPLGAGRILRYDGASGDFLGVFAFDPRLGALHGLAFGSDSNL